MTGTRCAAAFGKRGIMLRELMPGISQHRFQTIIQRPSAQALVMLAPFSEEIFSKWKKEVRTLGIDSQDFLGR